MIVLIDVAIMFFDPCFTEASSSYDLWLENNHPLMWEKIQYERLAAYELKKHNWCLFGKKFCVFFRVGTDVEESEILRMFGELMFFVH